MGCCLSTGGGYGGEKEAHLGKGVQSSQQKPSLESRAPPPSAEEETVKEVLSETPKPKAPRAPKAHVFVPEVEDKKRAQIETPAAFVKIQEKEIPDFDVKTEPRSQVIEEYSASEDVSEICSVSLSESVSTVTDRRDEEEEVRQHKVFRSPARSAPRNGVVGRSPTRKLDQSPGRRNGVVNGGSSVRLVHSREPPAAGRGRRGPRPDPPRKDPAESSGRRSRSPAVNRSVMGRSPSGRRTNHSPGRVRGVSGECGNSKRMEQQQHGITTTTASTTMEGKWPSSNNNGATASASATTSAANESLENPLVSLECFIFL